MRTLSPDEWRARYGPAAGDRVRLGDTDLWVRVADDRQARGDEPLWGYARNLRARMSQGRSSPSELDVVIAGVIVLDPVIGAVKADIGIKDGRIVGVGRAGNSLISDGIDLPIGPHTNPIMGYGLIATPGGVDTHVHSFETTFYVLEGSLRIFLQKPKQEIRLQPGETFTAEARRPHLVTNGGKKSVTFLVLQGIGEYDFVPLLDTRRV